MVVACLDGSVACWRVAPEEQQAGGGHQHEKGHPEDRGASGAEATGQRRDGLGAALLWAVGPPAAAHAAPVFSSPAVCDGAGCVAVAHVDGWVVGHALADGAQVRPQGLW